MARSEEVAAEFIRSYLPGYVIHPVPRDGLCIFNAFRVNLLGVGQHETIETISSRLKSELEKDEYMHYMTEDKDIVEEVDRFLKDPLKLYNKDIADIFLEALSMAFKVNIIIFQSDVVQCQILENINPNNMFRHTIYFVRGTSLHFDPVIPISMPSSTHSEANEKDEEEHELKGQHDSDSGDSDSGESISFVGEKRKAKENPKRDVKDVPKDDVQDFRIITTDSNDDSDDSVVMTEETKRPFQPSNTKIKSELEEFDYANPKADDIFRMILVEPEKYEVPAPLQGIKKNKVYTVKGYDIKQIGCDNNGAYHKTNTNAKEYYVSVHENGCDVHILRGDSKGYFYKERKYGNHWENVYVRDEDIYILDRYYRFNKLIPGLTHMIIHAKSYSSGFVYPYTCVIYSRSDSEPPDVVEVKCLPHGNSKQPSHLSQPYIRTNPSVLARMDKLLENESSPSSVYYSVLDESGGPMLSSSPSNEPRNTKQAKNRKYLMKSRMDSSNMEVSSSGSPSNLDKLLREQRDKESPVRTVIETKDYYIAFLYTKKQLQDIELFCCNSDNRVCVLGVDTTFKLCDMWLTDTSYRNERLISRKSRKSPVNLGPVMLHFTKDEETFRRFFQEMQAANPAILNLRKVGADMEAAIFNGFKSVTPNLKLLYCVRHLQKRDELSIENLQKKSGVKKTDASYKQQILWDIYGKRVHDTFEQGLADADDSADLEGKLNSLKARWEKLCPGFYDWFAKQRKTEFIECVIKSAREGTNIDGLYYQNDIESLHAVEKRIQNFKKGSINDAVRTINELIKREEKQEVMALYGGGDYALSQPYQNWYAPNWHSWDEDRREKYLEKFRAAKPCLESTFVKPANSGQKPGHKRRQRAKSPVTIVLDRHAPATTTPSFVTTPSTGVHATPTSSVSSTSVTSTSTVISTATITPTASSTSSISFPDPREGRQKVFELYLRAELPKIVTRCRGNCQEAISRDERLLVKSIGWSRWRDPKTQEEKSRYGPLYIHFRGECLKEYDTDEYYAPEESFKYNKIKLNEATKGKLSDSDKVFLAELGITI